MEAIIKRKEDFYSFLSRFDREEYQFRVLPCPQGGTNKFKVPRSRILEDRVFDFFTDLNHRGHNIHFVIQPGGQTNDKIQHTVAHFVDIDDENISLESLQEKWGKTPPHIVVQTSPLKYHIYWLTDKNLPSEEYNRTQVALAAYFGGDPSVKDLARIMRVPGFRNTKYENECISSILLNDILLPPYSSDSFIFEAEESIPFYISPSRKLLTHGVAKGDRNLAIYSYALSLCAIGYSKIQLVDEIVRINVEKCSPPLPLPEVHQILNSATKSGISKRSKGFDFIPNLEDAQQEQETEDEDIPYETLVDIVRASPDAAIKATIIDDLPTDSLVYDVYKYLMTESFKTTREIAIAGALAFVGAIKGHSVKSYTNARTNLFLLCLAPSGTGKTEVKAKLLSLAAAAGIKNLVITNPASETGLLDALKINARRFIAWDEFGLRLSSLLQTKSSYESGIIPFLLEIFSAAGSVFYDKTRRSILKQTKSKEEGKTEYTEQQIASPHLGIFAITTPETFFRSVSLNQISDGFIPRFCPIVSPPSVHKKREEQKIPVENPYFYNFTADLVNRCSAVYEKGAWYDGTEDTASYKMFSESAFELWSEFEFLCSTKQVSEFTPLYLRAAEHAMKIALTLSEDEQISEEHTRWAIEFVTRSIETFISALLENSQSFINPKASDGSLYLMLLSHIRAAGETGLSISDITAKFKNYKEYKGCLNSLVESKAIERFAAETGDRRKRTTVRYRVNKMVLSKAISLREEQQKKEEKESTIVDQQNYRYCTKDFFLDPTTPL